jgi:hypothetical protein
MSSNVIVGSLLGLTVGVVVEGFFELVVERFLGAAANVDAAPLELADRSSVGAFAVIVVSCLLVLSEGFWL